MANASLLNEMITSLQAKVTRGEKLMAEHSDLQTEHALLLAKHESWYGAN
jgi:hypothetical protein